MYYTIMKRAILWLFLMLPASSFGFFVPAKHGTELSILVQTPLYKKFFSEITLTGALLKHNFSSKYNYHTNYKLTRGHSALISYIEYSLNPYVGLAVSLEVDTRIKLTPTAVALFYFKGITSFMELGLKDAGLGVKYDLGKWFHVGFVFDITTPDNFKSIDAVYGGIFTGFSLSKQGVLNFQKLKERLQLKEGKKEK